MERNTTIKKIEELILHLRLQTALPCDANSLQKFWDDFGGHIPADVAAFYSLTDGGKIPELECRFYGLEEATQVVEHVKELQTEMPLIPVFEAGAEASDPVCVLLEPGLVGTVVQLCHDTESRVHACSFYDFLLAIAELDDGPLVVSKHNFYFPKRVNREEQAIADKLVERSNKEVNVDSGCIAAEYEPELFAELAQSMSLDESSKASDPFTYKDSRARHYVALALYFKGTPEAKEKLAGYCRIMNEFAKDLKSALAKDGVNVELQGHAGVVQTCYVCYRERRVLVDDVYSDEMGIKRWSVMRTWIDKIDQLLDG